MRWMLFALAMLALTVLDAALLVVLVAWPPLGLGPVETVALVVVTALLGMLFVRAEGRRTLAKIQRSLARGEAPTDELVDGGLLIAAGAFLLTPGFVTDLAGLLLVLPPTRIPVRWVLKKYFVVPMVDEKTGGFATGNVWTAGFPPSDTPSGTDGGSSGGDDYVDVDFERDDDT
jgi:UPF0716 protein FxsA